MLQIRPISDLRNKFTEISKDVHEKQEPIVLTRNGYGDMVVMSYELFARFQAGENPSVSIDETTIEAGEPADLAASIQESAEALPPQGEEQALPQYESQGFEIGISD